jgi:hypothetical protein
VQRFQAEKVIHGKDLTYEENGMRIARNFVVRWMFCAAIAVLLVAMSVAPSRTEAQSAGNKAVYNSSSTCCSASSAYIDASAVTQGTDLCNTLYLILTGNGTNGYAAYPNGGAVIDARGISGLALNCTSGSPWVQGTNLNSSVATILLPAGTVTISKTWIIPEFSRVIGEGPGVTTLATASTFSSSIDSVNAMVELGSTYTSTSCTSGTYCFCGGGTTRPADCVSVGVRDLTLDASNYTGGSLIIGVENEASQELSFVDHVEFNDAPSSAQSNGMLGLKVYTDTAGGSLISANNSGPYSNLIFTAGSNAGVGTQCASITGVAGTRGIHGLSCMASLTTPPAAAITLDGNSTSIEDVYINGFGDGIRVGSVGPAQADVLSNIAGGSSLTNLINIENQTGGSSSCPPGSSAQNVCDLSILHATSAAGTTIDDQVTGASLSNSTDPLVGMYILGEQLGTSTSPIQYSRFSTSPTYPTWGVGNTSPASGSSCNATSANGSLYSNSSSSSTTGTLFVCVSGAWVKAK